MTASSELETSDFNRLIAQEHRERLQDRGIGFREAGERKVAWLAGTRSPVWMVLVSAALSSDPYREVAGSGCLA